MGKPLLTSSLCSFFSRSSTSFSLCLHCASSFSRCRFSCCSCWGLKGATRRGDPGGTDPLTAAAGRWRAWTGEHRTGDVSAGLSVYNNNHRFFFCRSRQDPEHLGETHKRPVFSLVHLGGAVECSVSSRPSF